jgi:hypothetical protein
LIPHTWFTNAGGRMSQAGVECRRCIFAGFIVAVAFRNIGPGADGTARVLCA